MCLGELGNMNNSPDDFINTYIENVLMKYLNKQLKYGIYNKKNKFLYLILFSLNYLIFNNI